MLARSYYFANDWQRTQQQLTEILSREPTHPVALRQQAQLQQQLKQRDR